MVDRLIWSTKGMPGQVNWANQARRNREQHEETYREKALKLFLWICARCGRQFSGKQLLTGHHKGYNHNPPDESFNFWIPSRIPVSLP